MELISETVLASDTASVTFSSIPQTYQHLRLICYARGTRAHILDDIWVRLNGDTGSSYPLNAIYSHSGTVTADSITLTKGYIGIIAAATGTAGVFGMTDHLLPDYTDATRHQPCYGSYGSPSASGSSAGVRGIRWTATAAVTQIEIGAGGDGFVTGSVFSLYGVN